MDKYREKQSRMDLYYEGLDDKTKLRFDGLKEELREMCWREGYRGTIDSALTLASAMKWSGTDIDYKASCLEALIREFLSDREAGFLMASLNLNDKYSDLKSAEKRRAQYQQDNYPNEKSPSENTLRRNDAIAISKLVKCILIAEAADTLDAVIVNATKGKSASSQYVHDALPIKIGDPAWNWQFMRQWAEGGEHTEDGFFVSEERSMLIIRNDNYEVAAAKTILTLEPYSKYAFSVEIRMTDFERSPKDEIAFPNHTGGSCPLYESFIEKEGRIIQYGTKMVTTSAWEKIEWTVQTNDTRSFSLELHNGGGANVCKGTAWFRNLTYKKI